MMRTAGLVGLCLAALSLGACFETPTVDIAFRCGPAGECPDNYECRDDGCCHLIGSSTSVTCNLPDAAVPGPDAATPDAIPPDAVAPDAVAPDAMAPDAMAPDAVPAGMLVSLVPPSALFDAGQTTDFTVTLATAAPAGGELIALMSSDAAVAAASAKVTVPEGMLSASFTVTGVGAGSATISASLGMDQLDSAVTVAAVAGVAGDVVINEFLAVSSTGNNSGEFIEVLNASAVTINIAGWLLTSDTIANTIVARTLNGADPVHLGPGDIAYGVANPVDPMDIPMDADFVYGPAGMAFELNDAGSNLRIGDGVTDIDIVDFTGWATDPSTTPTGNQFAGLLTPAATAADAIGYGTLAATVDGVDGLSIVETAAATGALGSSLARSAAGADTGDNAADLHVDPTPTPGVPSDAVSVAVLGTVPDDGLADASANVAVLGTDLVFGAQFTVGATAATCTVTNATSASCTFPDNGGTAAAADVTAQNPDGGSGTLTGGFTYTGVLPDLGATFWCNTQFPTSTTTTAGVASATIYGQIYVSGMTDASTTQVAGIAGQVGYGADMADPTAVNFTWGDAIPNPGFDYTGNNDEHQGTITPAATGSYDYAYRFSLDGGLNYYYCDASGSNDGYAPGDAGNLTVN